MTSNKVERKVVICKGNILSMLREGEFEAVPP